MGKQAKGRENPLYEGVVLGDLVGGRVGVGRNLSSTSERKKRCKKKVRSQSHVHIKCDGRTNNMEIFQQIGKVNGRRKRGKSNDGPVLKIIKGTLHLACRGGKAREKTSEWEARCEVIKEET